MKAFAAMSWNGFREARRNRVTVVVAAFLGLLLLSSQLVTDVTVNTFDRVLTDFGLGTMSLILVFLAVFLSTGLLSREIERKTIYLIVSKPVSRTEFLLARVAGNMITLTVLLLLMAALFFVELKVFGAEITRQQFIALAGLWVELLVLTSAGVLMSSFSGTTVAAITVVGLYLAGHLAPDLYTLSGRAETAAAFKIFAKGAYYALPNLERLNFRPQAAYQLPVSGGTFLANIGFGFAWSALLLGAAATIFNRRDFK